MHVLIDTNILIAIEPTAPSHQEAGTAIAVRLTGRLQRHGHVIFVHPAGLDELAHDSNRDRRQLRAVLAGKYQTLAAPPPVSDEMRAVLGEPGRPNDAVDDLMLAAVAGDAVHLLITADRQLRKKARRVDLDARVLSVEDALELLERLHPEVPEPPPSVERRLAHELDPDDPIFDSLREAYAPDFDDWFARVRRDQRVSWVIERQGRLAGICLTKDERTGNDLGLPGPTLKLSTFKVSPEHPGHKFGELLLHAALEHAGAQRFRHIYLSVFPTHQQLIAFLEDFGFTIVPTRASPRGEHYLHKRTEVDAADGADLPPLEYHRRYGPPALPPHPAATYVIPIQPQFHRMLFPYAQMQPSLDLEERRPYSNAIKKAYLCRANIAGLEPGGLVAFYQSSPAQSIDAVGVVESTLRSRDPQEVIQFVGTRTVYPLYEIESMCREREVLAILFRHDRVVRPPIRLDDLVSHQAVRSAPQTTVRIEEEGAAWLHRQLGR